MIEIPEPPDKQFCASCMQPLTYLYSARKSAWVAFVPSDVDYAIAPHRCRHAQDPATWRDLRRADPPSAEYVAMKDKIKSAPKETA